jgi:hypothetical protein
MKTVKAIVVSAWFFAIVIASVSSQARAEVNQCKGRLHQDQTDLWIGGGNGEGESICLIGKADRKRVLAVCTPEQPCRIRGHMANCRDAGECSEFSRIISVQKR